MKRVHLFCCFTLWSLWLFGLFLLLLELEIVSLNLFWQDFNYPYFNIAGMYNLNLMMLSLLPIEPILFIIALIIETLEWTKRSFLTVVLPFFITAILWFVHFCVCVSMF